MGHEAWRQATLVARCRRAGECHAGQVTEPFEFEAESEWAGEAVAAQTLRVRVAGVPDYRIQVVNHGPNNDWPGLKWNRRVEVEFQPQP